MHLLRLLGSLFLLAISCAAVNILPAVGPTVADQYIVMMTAGTSRPQFDSAMNLATNALGHNDRVLHQYFFNNFRGFSIKASSAVMSVVQHLPGIEMIEPDSISHLDQRVLQEDCTYGLDRISHRNAAFLQGRRPYEFIYFRPVGQGTTIYVIDSGIYIQHDDFTGRARKGAMYAPDNVNGNPNNFEDYTGHGTHVASIAGGYDYGVAKAANLVDVKVFNDNGSSSAAFEVAGIEYAVNDARSRNQENKSVINMSFGGPSGANRNIVVEAVREATAAGILCVAAAGNEAINADYVVPANVPEACTVGASNAVDSQTPFSNYGDSLDIWAPGFNIPAAIPGARDAIGNKSGTSMAAPYVSGVSAYLKAGVENFMTYMPVEFCQNLQRVGTKGKLKFAPFAQPPGPNIIVFDLGNDD